MSSPSRLAAVLLHTLAVPCAAIAQKTEEKPYEPHVGQPGKDVVWVPTPQALVEKMLDMAKVTPKDYLMDLGSGDGRLVITAAKRGISALGIEYDPNMVALSKRHAEHAGVAGKATFVEADLFETDFKRASVITMFLMPDINLKLRPKILDLKPGTRVVSNSFTMGDWTPDATFEVSSAQGCSNSWCNVLFWVVPAKVAGTWKVPQGELTLKQEFQMLSGTFKTDGRTLALQGQVRGEEIAFKAGGREYRGKLNGKTLELR